MHFVYELIWFKLILKLDTAELYILILVYMTLTLVQDQRGVKEQENLHQLSHTLVNQFEWN